MGTSFQDKRSELFIKNSAIYSIRADEYTLPKRYRMYQRKEDDISHKLKGMIFELDQVLKIS